MVYIKISGVKEYYEPKTGKTYRYHRKTNTRLFSEPGTDEFHEELKAAKEKEKLKPKPIPGTLGLAITEYKKSHWYQPLSPRTKKDYNNVMDYLKSIDSLVLKTTTTRDIIRIRDKTYELRKRRFANYVVTFFSIIFEFSKEQGYVNSNPAKGIKKIKKPNSEPSANRPWENRELQIVFNRLPIHLLVPVAISRWTGLREGDILKLPQNIFNGSSITYSTSKAGIKISMPVAQPLREILDQWIDHLEKQGKPRAITFCVNSRGRPWTESGFRASFFKHIRELTEQGEIGSGLTFHGLRHTVGKELRELGFDKRTIADMLGQKTEAMAEHYSKDADLSRKMKGVIHQLEIEHKKNKSV